MILSILVNPTEVKQGAGGKSRCEPRKTPGFRKQPTSQRSLKPIPSPALTTFYTRRANVHKKPPIR